MILVALLPVVAIVFSALIIALEESYYTRHPEQARPEASEWP